MHVQQIIKRRLEELRRGQRELAEAAEVTESYISQLLTGKKSPPAPHRSDIYDRMESFLKLPAGELSKLADLQREEQLRRKTQKSPRPLFQEIRDRILRKCRRERTDQLRPIFEKEPFGEIERLVTQKLLSVAQGVVREEWRNENWLRVVARINNKTYEQMRAAVLEFLDIDMFSLSAQNFIYFLDPIIRSWDIDLVTFGMQVVLTPELGREQIKRFEFVERKPESREEEEPGLRAFLQDASLSRNITEDEIGFLKRLRFKDKSPTPLYYYRELQNLRDPLHFETRGFRQERGTPSNKKAERADT